MTDERGTERTDPHDRRRTARWGVLGLAAAAVLGWAGWFAWLVAVELRTERILHDPANRLSFEEVSAPATFESFLRLIETKTGVHVEASLPEEILRADWPLHFDLGNRRFVGDLTTPQFDAAVALNVAIEQEWIGKMFDLRIEGDRFVITTADKAPSFDASAKAREWWHALGARWEGR